MVARHLMFLAAFFVEPHAKAALLSKNVTNVHIDRRTDASKRVDHEPDQGSVSETGNRSCQGLPEAVFGFHPMTGLGFCRWSRNATGHARPSQDWFRRCVQRRANQTAFEPPPALAWPTEWKPREFGALTRPPRESAQYRRAGQYLGRDTSRKSGWMLLA